ncbi:MAG: hypothetical protein ACP5I4_08025 [Oceanipulchritudo sp.]
MKNILIKLLIAGASMAASVANGALIIQESFNYNLGGVADEDSGANGGSGLPYSNPNGNPGGSGTGLRGDGWDGAVASGLSYPGLAVSGNGLQAGGSNAFSTWVYRFMSTDPWAAYRVGGGGNFGADGTTLYFSFLMRTDVTGEGGRAQVMITPDQVQRLYFGVAENDTVLSIVDSANSTHATSVLAEADTTYLIVVRIDFASGNDTVSMYVNPVPGTAEPEAADAVKANFDIGSYLGVGFRYLNTMLFDEFRMGTSWADVTPPPAESALIAYEDFDYTAGTTTNDADAGLNGGNGLPYTNAFGGVTGDPAGTGKGLRNNWATGTITNGGLSYAGLSAAANAYLVTGSNNVGTGDNPWIYRNMTVDPYAALRVGGVSSGYLGADDTTIWFSMLLSVSSVPTNNNNDRAIVQLVGNPNSQRFTIGLPNSSTSAGLFGISSSTGAAAFSTRQVQAGTTHLLVARLVSQPGQDALTLWVDPVVGNPLGAPDATLSGIDFGGFSQFSPRFAGTTMTLDEVRIGTTYESVTPSTSLPPAAAPLISSTLSGANMIISLQSQSGYDYTLQQSTTGLGGGNFSSIETLPGNDGTLQFTAPGPGAGKVFYRVEVNP